MKEYLSRRSIPFVEKDVAADPAAAAEMVRLSGQRGVPVTVIDGRVVVGYDQATLNQLLVGAQRPRLGAAVADAAEMAAKGRCHVNQGAYVGRVTPNSPAARAGLLAGDVIIAIAGRAVSSAADVEALASRLRAGTEWPVRYVRGDATLEGTLTV